MKKGCNGELQPLQLESRWQNLKSGQRLIVLSFDRDFLTGFAIKIDLFLPLFLEELITGQILLNLVVGFNRTFNRLCYSSGLADRRGRCRCRWRLYDRSLAIDINDLVPTVPSNRYGINPGVIAHHPRDIGGLTIWVSRTTVV